MTTSTAYIDMEFAGIYGTRQSMQIPIEIGMVIHNQDTDILSFTGKAFSFDIDVELWKNVMNEVGKRIDGQRRVFNLLNSGHAKNFNQKFHLNSEGRKGAQRAIAAVHRDLREFMQALNQKEIDTLVFFARQREMETFKKSRVKMEGFLIRDLQAEIKTQFHLKEHVSLDRMSLVTGFTITRSSAGSTHFTYTIPERFRYLIKPHKAIGDAARMFIVDREVHLYPEEFRERLNGHLALYERGKLAESLRDDETGSFQPQTM
jgi:hypothetical protein